ncbi:hypothetical protein J6590_060355 [Homalodisca vitripennis]|nr:hypothetical protein J6590_060355 [Homalodisca vitripennis]
MTVEQTVWMQIRKVLDPTAITCCDRRYKILTVNYPTWYIETEGRLNYFPSRFLTSAASQRAVLATCNLLKCSETRGCNPWLAFITMVTLPPPLPPPSSPGTPPIQLAF